MGITKPSIDMLDPGTKLGSVKATGSSLAVESETEEITEASGYFDSTRGILTLEIPSVGKINVSGFLTPSSIGEGKQGRQGVEGRQGTDGILGAEGDKGSTGCPGPQGKDGEPGQRGAQGQKGEPGDMGPTGAQGEAGDDGGMAVYIQSDDPGPVGAGALWVRP